MTTALYSTSQPSLSPADTLSSNDHPKSRINPSRLVVSDSQLAIPRPPRILSVNFNEDTSCFAVTTNQGFSAYNTDPFQERFQRQLTGGLSLAEIYARSNIVFLVGKSGCRSVAPPNQLIIWDDRQGKTINEISFATHIRTIQCRGNRLIVVEENKISLLNIINLSLEKSYETGYNPTGLVAINHPESEMPLIAFPDLNSKIAGPAALHLEYFKGGRTAKIIEKVHASPLSQIALTENGRLVATSSERGTLIRIWDTFQGTKLRELRRGLQMATIQSLVLHPTGRALVVASNSGTVHIYSLASRMSVDDDYNRRSSLSFLSGVLPKYFSSEWSMITIPVFADVTSPQKVKCAFGLKEPGTLIVIGDGGYYEKYRYTTQEYRLLTRKKFGQSTKE